MKKVEKRHLKLFAPSSYLKAGVKDKDERVNGCGPQGSINLVPDSIYGLDVSEACNIHDWQYSEGKKIADKESADRSFLNNLLRLIKNAGGPAILQWLRRRRALKYFLAVKHFGGPAFWDGKK